MAEDSKAANFEALTGVLGAAIISWSHCEEATEHLLRDLLVFNNLEKATADIIAATLDLKARCSLSLALAYRLKIPHDLMDRLATAINAVQNDARNTRNRIFHDSWLLNKGEIHKRTSTGPKLTRPQSRQLELSIPDYQPVNLTDVTTFSERCIDLSREIHDILGIISDQYFQALRIVRNERSRGRRTWWSRLLQRIFGTR
jgi:hypothetical protein